MRIYRTRKKYGTRAKPRFLYCAMYNFVSFCCVVDENALQPSSSRRTIKSNNAEQSSQQLRSRKRKSDLNPLDKTDTDGLAESSRRKIRYYEDGDDYDCFEDTAVGSYEKPEESTQVRRVERLGSIYDIRVLEREVCSLFPMYVSHACLLQLLPSFSLSLLRRKKESR
jgi:hypothetical protein